MSFSREFLRAHNRPLWLSLIELVGTLAHFFMRGAMMALGAYVALSYVGFIK